MDASLLALPFQTARVFLGSIEKVLWDKLASVPQGPDPSRLQCTSADSPFLDLWKVWYSSTIENRLCGDWEPTSELKSPMEQLDSSKSSRKHCSFCFEFGQNQGVAERQYLNGILGESVTFQLKSNLPFVSVSWIKIVDHNFYKPENISVVTSGEPCSLLVPLPALQDRVKVSEDCRGLQLSPLKQDDRGYYMAEIVLSDEEMVYESFELQVSSKYPSHGSKLLLCPGDVESWGAFLFGVGGWGASMAFAGLGDESDLHSRWAWKGSLAAELLYGGLERQGGIDWESPIYHPFIAPHPPVIKVNSQDLNVKVTCTVENQISKASRTVFLKDVCS
ncbi:hypothetical protein E2320_013705, partial [Naja naja]